MKRFAVCISVFFLVLSFSGSSVHAETPKRLDVKTGSQDPDKGRIHIYGIYFGDDAKIGLVDDLLADSPSSGDFIEAAFLTVLSLGNLIWLLPAISLSFYVMRRLYLWKRPLAVRESLVHK